MADQFQNNAAEAQEINKPAVNMQGVENINAAELMNAAQNDGEGETENITAVDGNDVSQNSVAVDGNGSPLELMTTALVCLQASGYLDQDNKPTPNLIKGLVRLIRNGALSVVPRFKTEFSWKELKAQGYKACFINENRVIYSTQLDKLYENVKDSDSMCFDETGKVVEAKKILDEGLGLHDIQGKAVTLDTPNLDLYLAVIDAQHRITVCEEHPEIDLYVELDEYDGSTLARIAVLNNMRKDHTGKDQKRSLCTHYNEGTELLQEMEEFQKVFVCTEKYAELMLTQKTDQFKRSEMTKIQAGEKELDNKYMGDPDLIQKGKRLMEAIYLTFHADQAQYRKVKKVEFPDSIFKMFAGLPDEKDQAEVFEKFPVFLGRLDSIQKQNIVSAIGKDSLQGLLNKFYGSYIKKHDSAGDWDAEIKAYNKAVDSLEIGEKKSSITVKKLNSGSPWDVLNNRKQLAIQKAEKEAKKAEKEAAKIIKNTTGSTPKAAA